MHEMLYKPNASEQAEISAFPIYSRYVSKIHANYTRTRFGRLA